MKDIKQQDFIDSFIKLESVRIFGYQLDAGAGFPLFIFRSDIEKESLRNLEAYLLKFRTTSWQRFLVKYFGIRIFLGFFKKVGDVGYIGRYLFWCDQCKCFAVNYKQGFSNRLDCQLCQERFLSGPFSKFSS